MASPKSILSIMIGPKKEDKESEVECKMAELIEKCFASRTLAHIAHLTTNSFAKHIALNDFYDDIVNEVDDIAENYIGIFGPLKGLKCCCADMPDSIVNYIQAEMEWIDNNRIFISKANKTIENLLDGLLAKYSKVLYKLKQLN